MGRFIVLHIPHIVPVLVAFAFLGRLALVVADQPPVHLDESAVDAWRRARAERATRAPRAALDVAHRAAGAGAAGRGDRVGARALHLRARRPASVSRAFSWGARRSSRRSRCCSSPGSSPTPASLACAVGSTCTAHWRRALRSCSLPSESRCSSPACGCSPRRRTAHSPRTSTWSRASGGSRSSGCTCCATSDARSTPRYAVRAPTSSRWSTESAHLTMPSSVAMQTAWAMLRAPSLTRI